MQLLVARRTIKMMQCFIWQKEFFDRVVIYTKGALTGCRCFSFTFLIAYSNCIK